MQSAACAALTQFFIFLALKRRHGSPTGRKHPEIINDNSPLIRDGQSNIIRPITTGRNHSIVHNLYEKAGLVTEKPRRRRYDPSRAQHTKILPHTASIT